MKFLLIACFVALAAADVSHIVKPAPSSGDAAATIVRLESEVQPDGSYSFGYETSNGIKGEEQGQVQGAGEDASLNVQGSNSWTAPDGQRIEMQYIADENGYQPQGSHIPTPPPIPEAILRSLKYIQEHPQAEQK